MTCFNRGGDRRSSLVGNYARLLRSMHWDYKIAPPFEVHCAHRLVPPPVDHSVGVPKRRYQRIRPV